MPKITLQIQTENLPAIEVVREVKTLRDVPKILKDAQASVSKVIKVFPSAANAKFQRVSVK